MSLTSEQRRALSLLRAQVREIVEPVKAVRKRAAAKARKVRGKALKDTAGQRHERVHDNAYLAHTRLQPCIVGPILGECEGRIDPAHLRFGEPKVGRLNPGMGRKPDDRWVLPLCRKHHTAQHAAGNERRWWSEVGIDPNEACIERYAAFRDPRSLAAWRAAPGETVVGDVRPPDLPSKDHP